MRPGEIDFSSRAKHYFDISNGEVLAGGKELDDYIDGGADPEHVMFIGSLLRHMDDEMPVERYDRVDYSGWTPEKFQEFGKWVEAVVAPPKNDYCQNLTCDVFNNANRLGIGPGEAKLRRVYGNVSNYYVEIKTNGVKPQGYFNDWDIDQFIEHIQKIGGDRRPTQKDINAASKESKSNPSVRVIATRFAKIGGFQKIVELAGYPVIDLWDRDDYIDWGVRFMKANNGLTPTRKMIDYLSAKKRGPSSSIVFQKFTSLSLYKYEIEEQYISSQEDQKLYHRDMLEDVRYRLRRGVLPIELFMDADATSGDIDSLMSKDPDELKDVERILELYAKYIVLDDLHPNSSTDNKISACLEASSPRAFVVACRKHKPIEPAEIEYSATGLRVFDLIWPLRYYYENLRIDDEFAAALEDMNQKEIQRFRQRSRRKAMAT